MSIIPQKNPLGDWEKLFRRNAEAPHDPCAVWAWKSHKEKGAFFWGWVLQRLCNSHAVSLKHLYNWKEKRKKTMIPLAPCSSPRMKPNVSTGVCLVPSASSLWDLSRELMQICRCSSAGYVNSNPGASCLLPASLKLAGSLSQSLATAQWLAHRGCWVNVGSSHRWPSWKPRRSLLFLRPSGY